MSSCKDQLSAVRWICDWLGVFAVLLLLVPSCCGLPDGTPLSACGDMLPGTQPGSSGIEGHDAESQNVLPIWGNTQIPPFIITVHGAGMNNSKYIPGERYEVHVMADQTHQAVWFKGILMMVRPVVCVGEGMVEVGDEPIGTFALGSQSILKTLDCGDLSASAVTHKTPQYKIHETVTWLAPPDVSGHLIFKATIVKERQEFWTDVFSKVLHDPNAEEPVTCAATSLRGRSWVFDGLQVLLLTASCFVAQQF